MIILISSFFLLVAGYIYIEIKGDDLPFNILSKSDKNSNINEQLAKNSESLTTLVENVNNLKESIEKTSEKVGSIEQGIVELLKQDNSNEIKAILVKIETAIQNNASNDILVLNTLNEICTSFKNLQEIETTVTSNNNSLINISKVLDEKFGLLSIEMKNQFDAFKGQINVQLKDIKNTAINSSINRLQTKIANASANTNSIKSGRIDNSNRGMYNNNGIANNNSANNNNNIQNNFNDGIVNNLHGNGFANQQAMQTQYTQYNNGNMQQQRYGLNSQQNQLNRQFNNQYNNNIKAEKPQEKISILNVKPKADDFSDFPSDLINEEVISGDEVRKIQEEEEKRIRIEEEKRKELEKIEREKEIERERIEREREKQLKEQERQERERERQEKERERQQQKAIEQRQKALEKQEQEKREREEKARRLAEKERIRQIKAEEKRRQEEEAMLRAEEKRREEEAAMAIVNNDSIKIEEKTDSIESLNEAGAKNTNNTVSEEVQPEALIKTEEHEEVATQPEDIIQEVSLAPTRVENVESKPYDNIENINIEDNTSTANATEQQSADDVIDNLVIDNTKTEENNDSLEEDLKNFDVKIGEIQDNVVEDNDALGDYSSKLDDFINNDTNINTQQNDTEQVETNISVVNNDEIKDKLKELKDKLNN